MGNRVDSLRHYSVFDPVEWGEKDIHVIGAGATGSKIVMELAKLGISNIVVYDFDVVEEHNIANQIYRISDIGKLKVQALSELVKEATGLDIKVVPEKVTGDFSMGEIVFLLTDTMSSRKEIFDGAIKMKLGVKLMIETRMGIDSGKIYTIIPTNRTHVSKWEKTLVSDDAPNLEVSACGSSITIGATAGFIASLAVWQFIRYYNITYTENTIKDSLENEIIVGLRDTCSIITRF